MLFFCCWLQVYVVFYFPFEFYSFYFTRCSHVLLLVMMLWCCHEIFVEYDLFHVDKFYNYLCYQEIFVVNPLVSCYKFSINMCAIKCYGAQCFLLVCDWFGNDVSWSMDECM